MANGTSCYKLHDGAKPITDALTYCRENGGDLASVLSPEESDFLSSTITSLGSLYRYDGVFLTLGAWGPYDSGVRRWTDGSLYPFYGHWDQGRPLTPDIGHDVTAISWSNGLWTDKAPDAYGFICRSHYGI